MAASLAFLLSLFLLSGPVISASVPSPNPFNARAASLRYWARKIPHSATVPLPDFLVSKLSPLSALDLAAYSSLAATVGDAFFARLPAFCTAAHLLCGPNLNSSLASHRSDADFSTYDDDMNFTNYGAGRPGGADTFKNYNPEEHLSLDIFRSYSRDSVAHDSSFTHYSDGVTIAVDNFTSYGSGAVAGASGFAHYEASTNIPDIKFTNYAAGSNAHEPTFTSYNAQSNAGHASFAGYGKDANSVPTTFTSYADHTNAINSGFSGYGESGSAAADNFAHYADGGNAPNNKFSNYGARGNAGTDTFTSYRDGANVGIDEFKSYAKGSMESTAAFTGYGHSANPSNVAFKSYGIGATDPNVTFKSYSAHSATDFKAYAKTGVEFKGYKNASAATVDAPSRRWAVEPGKFFRESSLQKGTVMPMPDVHDRMPPRSFLPRSIAATIPFTAAAVLQSFDIPADTAMGKAVAQTIAECARAPSKGETKRCATSAEDMFDFAASAVGDGAVVRSTRSAAGSGGSILIGDVRGVANRAVSCHQSLFPYLVYYCHWVPAVRVYEAEILDVHSKERINSGVAICHVDTSDWSAGHGAFVALGAGPGKIEVCHWIFQGDMTWTG